MVGGRVPCDSFDRLRVGGTPPDRQFDEVYPRSLRKQSRTHFTPVAVARRAAEWLVQGAESRVLDVGAGVGKFCIVGALTTEGSFEGIEQRPRLVVVARQVVAHYGVDRCRFRRGSMMDVDWGRFQGFYLYNPFEELRDGESFDDDVHRSPERFRAYVQFVERELGRAPAGTRVATFHGFGGVFPAGWQLVESEDLSGGRLECWIRG